jgi:hypothetical protein
VGGFLKAFSAIAKPEWWSDAFERHDYACMRASRETRCESPFIFDLDDNIGVTDGGALYMHDYEFVQWCPTGLQEVYLALKALLLYRKEWLWLVLGDGGVHEFTRHLVPKRRREMSDQAARAHRARLRRRGTLSRSAELKIELSRRVLQWL